jgi:hypothetical protein
MMKILNTSSHSSRFKTRLTHTIAEDTANDCQKYAILFFGLTIVRSVYDYIEQ